MNINTHSTLNTPRTFIRRGSNASQQTAPTPDSTTLGISRADLKAGGYGLVGGLALGGAGMFVGVHAGMEYGMSILDSMGPPALKLAGLLVALPVGVAYAAVGGAVGGAIGGGLGVAAGMGLHHLTSKPE